MKETGDLPRLVESAILEPAPWSESELPAHGSRWRTIGDLDLRLARPWHGPNPYDGGIGRTPPPPCPELVTAGTRLRFVGCAGHEDPCTYLFPEGLLFQIVEGTGAGGIIVVYPASHPDAEMALVRLIVTDPEGNARSCRAAGGRQRSRRQTGSPVGSGGPSG
jgi:hypothetical protein